MIILSRIQVLETEADQIQDRPSSKENRATRCIHGANTERSASPGTTPGIALGSCLGMELSCPVSQPRKRRQLALSFSLIC